MGLQPHQMNMNMKKILIIIIGLLMIDVSDVTACTSAIISGKVTADGRPLMWKNRDSGGYFNCVRYMKGKKYNFIAVTSYGSKVSNVWAGTNETGFSIMNTVSYNLIEKAEDQSTGFRNGSLMRRALEICATVEDFRNFLDTLKRPLKVETNYGIIDAKGGAAYFEVDWDKYTFFDVNDPNVAPHGYLVRANFSVSGKLNDGAGYVRYQEAEQQLFNATPTSSVTPKWIFDNLARSFHNPLMGIDLKSGRFNKPETTGWFVEQDFIARRTTACAVVVQGVKPDEDPSFTTMWTSIGYPPVCPAIPVWVKGAETKLPRLLYNATSSKSGVSKISSPLCDAADIFRQRVYSYNRGKNTEKYMNWELLFNRRGTGAMQLNDKIENELFSKYYTRLEDWRKTSAIGATPSVKDIYALYDECDEFISAKFKEYFDLEP